MKKILVVVGGPTASGKTQLAINLATHFSTEIISADSRQFYREISIGTAKPDPEQLKQVKHHFINSHSVSEPFNAGDYGVAARTLMNNLFEKYKIIVMAGGSGLYIDAAISGIDDLPGASPEIRNYLNNLFKNSGLTGLQELLKEKDPVGFSKIDSLNPRRLIRALEICLASGKEWSALLGKKDHQDYYDVVFTGIDLPRDELYRRINARVDLMIADGLLTEAESVKNYSHLNALKTVGYKEMFEHLDGKITLQEATEQIAKNTRNYAKRQMTWFRKYQDMIWIQPGGEDKLIGIIKHRMTG